MRPGAKPRAVCSCESKSGAILTATRSEYDAQFQRMLQWAIRQKSRKIADGQLLGIKMLRLGRLIIVGGKLRFGQKIAAFSLPKAMLSSMG